MKNIVRVVNIPERKDAIHFNIFRGIERSFPIHFDPLNIHRVTQYFCPFRKHRQYHAKEKLFFFVGTKANGCFRAGEYIRNEMPHPHCNSQTFAYNCVCNVSANNKSIVFALYNSRITSTLAQMQHQIRWKSLYRILTAIRELFAYLVVFGNCS